MFQRKIQATLSERESTLQLLTPCGFKAITEGTALTLQGLPYLLSQPKACEGLRQEKGPALHRSVPDKGIGGVP